MRARILADLTDAEIAALEQDWRFWGRPEQIAPPGNWKQWLFMAGRGAGKTRAGSEWVREKVKAGAGRVALIAPTAADARDVMVEGDSGLLAICHEKDCADTGAALGRPLYESSKRRLTWENGAQATLFTAEEPDRLRGPQSHAAWCDELAAWANLRETFDMAMFGLRLGEHPQAMITTTPRPLPLLRELLADPETVVTRGSTFDNAANLAGSFLASIRRKYEGTRLGRQEMFAELLEDLPGALWQREWFDKQRVADCPDLKRVVVAIDPSGTSGGDGANDVGIVVAAKGVDGRGYVLADRTCSLSPDGWGRRAVQAYHEFRADCIVAETNFGGAMVGAVIRNADRNVPYREVRASRGKVARAEPVAQLYEQGRVSHVGSLPQLEDQLCLFGPEGYAGEGSPDRGDALVWAMSEMMLGPQPSSRTTTFAGAY